MWAHHLSQLLVPPKCETEDDSRTLQEFPSIRRLVHQNAVSALNEIKKYRNEQIVKKVVHLVDRRAKVENLSQAFPTLPSP